MGAISGPRPRSIKELKGAIMRPALTSHYEVHITPPPDSARNFISQSYKGVDDKLPEMKELLTLSCSDASLPGSTLSTHELNNDFTGVTQRHAYRRLYDDRIDFSFYVNHKYEQIRYFESWMRFIVGEQLSNGEKNYLDFRVQYPKNYKSNIYITKFERDNGKVVKVTKELNSAVNSSQKMTYTFINAFPINISSMPISYEASQLLKVTVSFTYDRYLAGNISGINNGNGSSSPPPPGVPDVSSSSSYWNTGGLTTPLQQAAFNGDFANTFQGFNFGNLSTGTFTNTGGFDNLNQSVGALF